MKMKKLLGSIKRPKHKERGESSSLSNGVHFTSTAPVGDGPDAVIFREVGAFCESGAPGSLTSGDEYLHLPAIVDAAESSPLAAKQAALRIRDYLGRDHYDRGYAQYNAIMLSRILTDNPGRPFTQNFDKDFIHTVKKLLRDGKDASVQQILRETLDYYEIKSHENDSLAPLIEMWRKEKGSGARISNTRGGTYGQGYNQNVPPVPHHRPRGLPPPDELAGRIEEARTTARLLVQTVQSTPSSELLRNDLVKEFAERARVAQKSVQGYMNAENPHPDDETMLTLIETSEQLNVAMSKHQRAVLQARRAVGATPSPQPQDPSKTEYMSVGDYVYGASQPPQPSRPQQQDTIDQSKYEQQPLSPPAVENRGRRSPRNENFAPPSGPPPGRPITSVYSDQQIQPSTYNTGSVITNHSQLPARSNYESSVSAPDDVGDNPFTDAASYEPPPRQQPNYSLFGRGSSLAVRTLEETNEHSHSPGDPPHSEPKHIEPQPRAGAYNPMFTSTASYIHRQESAGEHITMHGASPPLKPVGVDRDK